MNNMTDPTIDPLAPVVRYRVVEVHQFKNTRNVTQSAIETYAQAWSIAAGARNTATFKSHVEQYETALTRSDNDVDRSSTSSSSSYSP